MDPSNKNMFFKIGELIYTISRYLLAILMMSFGVMKIMGVQFSAVFPESAYGQTLNELTGRQLTWAFLGHSVWFQVVLGVFEFVPSCLLLFRRTALMGTLLLLPMSIGVFLVNISMALWFNTQLLSIVILCLNILLLLLRYKTIAAIWAASIAPASSKYRLPELILAAIIIVGITGRKAAADYDGKTNKLTGDSTGLVYEFELELEAIDDSIVRPRRVKCYFGKWGMYSECNDSVNNRDDFRPYSIEDNGIMLHIPEHRYMTEKSAGTYYHITGKFEFQLRGDILYMRQLLNDSVKRTLIFKKRVIRIK